jgi:hypothetical protein
MRASPIALLVATAASGQVMLDPARLGPSMRYFEPVPGEKVLECTVAPIRPLLNFSFRLQAGYVVRIPMGQFFGSGHGWAILTRITPDSGGAPAYLASRYRLPNIPKTGVETEIGGGFLLGPGKYHVAWRMFDETGRTCRAAWTIDAKLSRAERGVKLAIAPNTVRELAITVEAPDPAANGDAARLPITVMLHAAPIFPRRTWLNGRDRMTLVGLLASLVERLPARSIRVVVFSLDQQKEIYRRDHFLPRDLSEVGHALDNLELGKVDVQVLEHRYGHLDLLANLLRREWSEPERSDAVLVLGPKCRFLSSPPASALDRPALGGPRYFYFQYEPAYRITQANLPDSIAGAMHRVKGKTLVIRTPADFAKAIAEVERNTRAN